IPASINRYLKNFQKDGVTWLYSRVGALPRREGAILADDMGLGKTVQVVSLLAGLLEKTGTGRDRVELERRVKAGKHASVMGKIVLVVAPSSVVGSWMDHLARWGHF
ncbi:unnamed protein product, partial [Discosporangium mesarthrocarpum]